MKYKRITALALAAAMVTGNGMAAFAADANSADGVGTLIPHLDREITAVTLPTDTAVATVFDYWVDPEQLIKDAGKLQDGSAVTGNDDGVYFVNAGTAAVAGTIEYSIGGTTTGYTITGVDTSANGTYTYDGSGWTDANGDAVSGTISITDDNNSGAAVTPTSNDTITVRGAVAGTSSYTSSSDAVKFEGKNSVDVNVKVEATIAAGAKDIALVADEAALASATTPALLMTMKVGADEKAITSAGATAKARIEGVPDNFEVTTENGNFKYGAKASAAADSWKFTTVQLSGKTNNKDVETDMTVPKITLTWSVEKADPAMYGTWSGEELWLAKDASTGGFPATGLTVEVSEDDITYKALASGKYSVSDESWVGITWSNIVEALGKEPGAFYVRITDGTTKYVFKHE